MTWNLRGVLLIAFIVATFFGEAQNNKIYLVSKVNNYTTFKLKGYSNWFWGPLIWYRVNTSEGTHKGLVQFSDSSLVVKRTTLRYDSIVSIEYSKFNKATNAIRLGYSIIALGVGTALVTTNDPNSIGFTLGLFIGIPGAVGTGFSLYEVTKPSVYNLDEYYIRTKKALGNQEP